MSLKDPKEITDFWIKVRDESIIILFIYCDHKIGEYNLCKVDKTIQLGIMDTININSLYPKLDIRIGADRSIEDQYVNEIQSASSREGLFGVAEKVRSNYN